MFLNPNSVFIFMKTIDEKTEELEKDYDYTDRYYDPVDLISMVRDICYTTVEIGVILGYAIKDRVIDPIARRIRDNRK